LAENFGNGIRDWVKEAIQQEGRKIAQHFFIPGVSVERLFDTQRDLWHKVWREEAELLEFSIAPELDIWWDIPLLQGRQLQYKYMELLEDMHAADLKMIYLLLDIKAGGDKDIQHFADYANQNQMRWVSTNLQGARDKKTFIDMLQVMIKYNRLLHPEIGVLVNGPSAEDRIRAVLEVFPNREISFSNAARIERVRRAF
jgi:hypothetical protein